MTESNKILNDKINLWVGSLTERLIEIRFFDVDDIKNSLKTHFKQAMIDCLKAQITKNQAKYNELKLQLPNLFGQKKQELQAELTALKEVVRKENILHSELDSDRKAKEMTLWMRERHKESLLEFYEQYDKQTT